MTFTIIGHLQAAVQYQSALQLDMNLGYLTAEEPHIV